MGRILTALPQNKHWSIGLGAKPSPQRAGIMAGLVWTLGGVGWKKETIHFSECTAGRRTDGGILCLFQWVMGQTGAAQSLDYPLPEPHPSKQQLILVTVGDREQSSGSVCWWAERDQCCLKILSISVCLHTCECDRWRKLINGSLRVRLHHCG